MAESEWTPLTGVLGSGSVVRGATAGIAGPPGGSGFVYGMNTLDTTEGSVGFFTNQLNFAPMAKGGSITGCLKRGLSGGQTNFAPFLFLTLTGTTVGDKGYLLGLGDADPSHIILRKGTIVTGLPDLAADAPNNGILRRSSATVARDTWVHLRLDVIVNTNGDVRLVVYQNNLTTHPLSGAPSWQPVAGMTDDDGDGTYTSFVDDVLQVNSGSAPLTSGRGGFAFWTKDVTRRGYFAHIAIERQN